MKNTFIIFLLLLFSKLTFAVDKKEELKSLDEEIIADLDFFQNYEMIKNQEIEIEVVETTNANSNQENSHEN